MWLFPFIFGLFIGSFLNAYIWRAHEADRGRTSRSPTSPSVWRGRSHCPKCRKPLRWFELIPLLSFIIQWGRCRGCGQKIDIQYPLVELATGVLFVLGYWELGIRDWEFFRTSGLAVWNLLKYWYFLSVLVVLFVYDLRYGLISDKVVLPAIVAAFVWNAFHAQSFLAIGYWLLATAIGALFFALQYYLSRGRAVGGGDIRFGALMGAMLGWPGVLMALVISYIIGGFTGAVLIISGKKRFGQSVPLGTFLAIGTAITLLYSDQILKWYLR